MSLAYNHVATFRAGSSGYYEHTGSARTLKRGVVTVEYDSSVYVYKKNGHKAGEWRAFIQGAFIDAHNAGQYRLTGRFPAYTIEVKS